MMLTLPATDTIVPLAEERRATPFDRSANLPGVRRPNATLSVLDVTKYFGDTTGGVRTYLLEKARYVSAREPLRHILVVPGANDSLAEIDGVRCYRLRQRQIPTQAPYRFLTSASMIRRIIEHEQPDLIEVGSPFAVPWVVARANGRSKVPMVWFSHSNLPRIAASGRGPSAVLAGRLARAYTRKVSTLFQGTLVGSAAAASDFAAYGVSPVHTVSLGVDTTMFHPQRRVRKSEIRKATGLPATPLAIFVGRLAREKRLDVLLDAWPEVEALCGARLLIVGDGPARARYRHHRYATRVIWQSFTPDRSALADLYAAADLFVTPSPAETFGLAVLEALASGLPVLAPDSGGAAELVQRSEAGDAFATGSPQHLAEKAVALLEGDLVRLGRTGRAYAEHHHAWPTVFDRLFALYHDILARG